MRDLTVEEVGTVSGGMSEVALAGAVLGGAALVAGGAAVGFGIAGAIGIIGVDAAFGGTMGAGLIGIGLGAASELVNLV